MSTPSPGPQQALEHLATFMMARARDVGVTEGQILQLLGFRNSVGPIETLLSGRPPAETIPEIAHGIMEGTDAVAKAARQQVEQAIPLVVLDELKPVLRKMTMLNEDGVKHLDIYLNFLISQGFIKK